MRAEFAGMLGQSEMDLQNQRVGEEAWQESVFRTELTKEGFVNFHAMDSRFCFCPFAMKREKTPI